MYFAIIFPEYLKTFAIILQAYDTDPEIINLYGLLIYSIQCQTLQCFLGKSIVTPYIAVIIGGIVKNIVRYLFFRS